MPKFSASQVEAIRKAAEQGDAPAQRRLGACYANGEGVTKDNTEAVRWYQKAAEQRDVFAQSMLGTHFDKAIGVRQDYTVAAQWYFKAAEQGDAMSQFMLGSYFDEGKGVPKDGATAAQWFRRAAEQGHWMAKYCLGCYYANGEGVPRDDVMAYKWWNLASAGGGAEVANKLDIISRRMTKEQIAEAQRLSREWKPSRAAPAKSENGSLADKTAVDAIPKIAGTGFLVTRSGYLVTNHHVVKGMSKVRVHTEGGLLDAAVVQSDEMSDLALLKVDGNFDALPVVSSRKARLGATVGTVGFPNPSLQGLSPKLSKGDISSLSGIQDDVRQFQISVPVQPGNSGGALFDERGNVVGVVVAMLDQKAALESTGTLAQNVNYAVKSSYLLSFLEAIPAATEGMLDERTDEQKFEAVVEDVKKATVLVVGY